jgi:DNA-binding transcriptional ArsR family regulator
MGDASSTPPQVVDGRLVISDPRAMRVLAHEARLAILDELDVRNAELTASELADRIGVSPSALSYHLRVLERFGILARAAPREDGRERPWRRVADNIVIDSPASNAGFAAQSFVISQILQSVQAHWDDWIRVEADEPQAWRDAATVSRARLWLTMDEATELAAELAAVLAKFGGRRDPSTRPPGSRQVEVISMLVPRTET